MTINPGPLVWGTTADLTPEKDLLSAAGFHPLETHPPTQNYLISGTESKQPKTRAASGNHKFLASYFQSSEILLIPHF